MSEMFELIGVLLLRPAVANIDRLDQSSDKACRLVVSLPDLLFISVRLDLLYPKHLTLMLSNSPLYPIHLTFCFGHSNSLLLLPWFYFYQYFFTDKGTATPIFVTLSQISIDDPSQSYMIMEKFVWAGNIMKA